MLGEASNLKSQGVNAPFLKVWESGLGGITFLALRVLFCLHLADNSAGMGQMLLGTLCNTGVYPPA